MTGESDPITPLERNLVIVNERGLHARAAAKFVKCAETFASAIIVTRDGQSVPGTSIMGLLMLSATRGSTIKVSASGADAAIALEALESLVGGRFGEE